MRVVFMRHFKFILCAFSLFAASELFAADGWIDLFNGRNLSGWKQISGDAKFYVKNGCVVGEAVSESETNSVLRSKKNYDNFILELDFKVDHQLFSGVHIRGQFATNEIQQKLNGVLYTMPAGNAYGYLVLIDPSPNHRWWTATHYDQCWWTAGIYDEQRRMWLYPGPLGGDPDEFSKRGREIFKTNDWNHLRIEAVGDSLKTFLNGTACAQIKDSVNPAGFIGLQVRDWISDDDHEKLEGAKVRFKNIRLKLVAPVRPNSVPPGDSHK